MLVGPNFRSAAERSRAAQIIIEEVGRPYDHSTSFLGELWFSFNSALQKQRFLNVKWGSRIKGASAREPITPTLTRVSLSSRTMSQNEMMHTLKSNGYTAAEASRDRGGRITVNLGSAEARDRILRSSPLQAPDLFGRLNVADHIGTNKALQKCLNCARLGHHINHDASGADESLTAHAATSLAATSATEGT